MLHIGRNIISLVISRLVAAVILFLIYTRLIQYLGPQAAGEFGLVAAYLTVFTFFVDLGMQQLVIKKVSEDKTQAAKYLNNYFSIQFFLGLIFMAIMDVFVLTAHYPPIVQNSLLVASIGLLLSSLTMPFMAIINSFQRLSLIARVNFVNSLINAGMMVLAIVFRRNIFFLSFIAGTVSLFDILIYGYLVNKKFARFRIEIDFAFWKKLILWNMPFMLLTIFSIYNRIDTLILPHLRNFTENGYYTAVYKFWDTLAFLPAVVAASLYPFFAEVLARGEKIQARQVLETYTRYMIAVGVPLTIGAYLLASKLTVAFYGQAFAPAAPALWLLVAAVSVLFVYVPVNSVIISQKTKLATIITGCTLVFNLVLNLIFIPKFGFVAAAVITLFSEIIQLIGYTIVVKRRIVDFNYLSNFIKPLIAGLVMGLALYYFVHLNVWILIVLGGGVYAVALLALRFFNKADWELLRTSIDFRKDINKSEFPSP
jgi:O-antigen/teichoic acid export membrane protein